MLPRQTKFDFLAYNPLGSGHYDAAVMKKQTTLPKSDTKYCLCDVDSDHKVILK